MWKWETEHDAKGVVVIVHNILEHTGRYAYVITMLRRNGYHVIMGDLPGQGQTSRANKGQLEHFDIYHETLIEWVRIANEYKIPTFVMGVGLGGLILLNVLEKTELPIEGMLLLSPLLEFKRNNKTRKNMLISNVGKGSKDARFKLGIETKDLTRNDEVIEETKQDGLMLRKVTYKWYNIVLETMKDTVQHFKDIQSMPTLLMYGTEDKLLELRSFNELKNNLNSNEFYFKVWEGFYHEIHNEPERDQVMRYVLTFLNNSVNTMGFIVNEEEIEEV
ncbi:alpha/beta hydrolase [Staphylococcus haemolyticus]|uniref:alpha/beta fold hydrolase n=1 Tax=Staphylococcus TaxID=1279 RepID=UPI00051D82AA|nr:MULTISPECIES: alpha/beta hydrolase [Staphylococcus]KGJ29754.1 lysophospholipase [Staphylococcus haemolyticus]KGJ30199.1 lysophospholipase [Staphylococcus haemolyticus]MCE4954196.1 alpha/beta hydrolase [Staphylococcus haemolyticus]MCE4986911.1 alpha/beta hydrolase [Staphylococcus haemolyticus]MCE4992007.1 alpha/beta hydrolase [Staphylococcus haemolyticus]